MNESPIFSRTHDLLLWLLRASRKFPREFRFTLAQEVTKRGFDLQSALVSASLDRDNRAQHLVAADIALTNLRKTLLICHQLELLGSGSYRHVTEMTDEVGRLLGGWQKREKK